MTDPLFLSRESVETLHHESLRRFGGSPGIRDEGLIESALASAQNTFFYASGDLYDIAAAYAFHIAQAQAYLDGNKRIAIAEKRLDKEGLARVFRELFQAP